MSAKINDTLYLAAGGLLLAGGCLWAFLQQADVAAFSRPIEQPALRRSYEPASITLAVLESDQWADVAAQPAGAGWIFDVFTPPSIYYNELTKEFTVTALRETVPTVSPLQVAKFGVQLVKVEQPLFRLQLVGYVGEGPSARGNFQNQRTGEVIFATSGKKLPDLNLEIVNFTAERRRIPVKNGTELIVTEATALVRDTVTKVETKLDAKVRTPFGPLSVTFKNELTGAEIAAKTGDTFTVGADTFTVGELQLTPPTAVVTKKAAGQAAAPETKTLEVPPQPAPSASEADPASRRSADRNDPAPDARPAPGGFTGF